MALDLRTIFILVALVSLMMSVTMFFTAYSYPLKKNSMRIWAIGSILRFVFWAMLAFRGFLPDFVSIVIANTGVILCEVILVKALRILQDKDLDNRWLVAGSSVSVVILSFFTYAVPSVFWRIEYIALASLGLGFVAIYTLLFSKRDDRTAIEIVCGLLYLISTISVIVRGVYVAFSYPEVKSIYSGDLVQTVSFAVIFVCIVMITFVYMMMVNHKFNKELKFALAEVKTLKALLPICSYCKNIRDEENYWHKVEDYIYTHTDTKFTHGICPECYETEVVPQLESFKQQLDD